MEDPQKNPKRFPAEVRSLKSRTNHNIDLIEYPYPLRSDLVVKILLPRDLRMIEAKRLGSYIATLAVNFGDQSWPALPRATTVEVEE